MKIQRIILLICGILISATTWANQNGQGLSASETPDETTGKAPFRVGVSAGASTNGVGGFLIGQINDRFKVRVGYEAIGFKLPEFDFEQGDYNYQVQTNLKTGGLSALVDARLAGSFYVTVGLVSSKLHMTMKLHTDEPVRFGDIEYSPEEVGEYQLDVKPTKSLAPYAGIGFAPRLSRDGKWKLNVDLGAHYIGGYTSVSSGTKLLSGNNDQSNEEFDQALSDIVYTKFYPTVRVGLSYTF